MISIISEKLHTSCGVFLHVRDKEWIMVSHDDFANYDFLDIFDAEWILFIRYPISANITNMFVSQMRENVNHARIHNFLQ